jgi:hypothetical protein
MRMSAEHLCTRAATTTVQILLAEKSHASSAKVNARSKQRIDSEHQGNCAAGGKGRNTSKKIHEDVGIGLCWFVLISACVSTLSTLLSANQHRPVLTSF